MSRQVLILEDSRTQAIIISKMFERVGYTPILAFDHEHAIATLQKEKVHLLVLDVFVERANTIEHLDTFRSLAPGVPVAIMTAGERNNPDAASNALNKARRARVDFLLPKPFHYEDVKQICEDVERLAA